MQQKRTRSSRPKLFQCTGFGDCNMVFTRSEHLARHSRKHTGEKPFVCVVPLCTKAFSRFDNMMQHTQTHRNNNYNIITGSPSHISSKSNQKHNKDNTTRSSTRVAQKQQRKEQVQQQHTCEQSLSKKTSFNNLYIQTTPPSSGDNTSLGLVSPVSLSSFSPKRNHTRQYSLSSSEDEDDDDIHQPITPTRRRLSVADLCNPSNTVTTTHSLIHDNNIHLTKDEYEALEGFGRFRHSPSVFFDSLKDLASTANIEPY